MYRKDAERLIVKDVIRRLPLLKSEFPWASWRFALGASQREHPDWYRHHSDHSALEEVLRVAGVDMTEPPLPGTFTGNLMTDDR